jgi:hypothetical protein
MYINVRENRRDNQDWTIQRHREHLANNTQNEDKQNKNLTQKIKKMSNMNPTKTSVVNLCAREEKTVHVSSKTPAMLLILSRRIWRYQRGNQNPYIEEGQRTQWPKKVQKVKQRSTKHTYKTKDRVTRTPIKTWGELRCSRRVSSSCSTSDTRRVNLVTHPVISHEPGNEREVFTTSGTYPWSSHVILFKQNMHGTLFTVFSSYPLLLFCVAFAYTMFVEWVNENITFL